MRILFVCLGNICRSPTAEGVMRRLVREAGLEGEFELDSAGTGGWHVGSPPDPRSTSAAASRGIVLEGAARQVTSADFERFDLLIAMDATNARELRRMAPSAEARAKVRMLRDLDPDPASRGGDVPDPYHGGERGFDDVLDLVDAACRGLLDVVRARR